MAECRDSYPIEGAVESKRAVIVSTGPGYTVPMDLMTALPERVKVVGWVDHAALLPRVAVVASHGGMGTCNDAIRHGLPMLNIPIGCDHPSASRKIERYGMTLRLALAKATPATIGAMMGELVDEPSFGRRARTLRDAWNVLGGAARAVDLIEETAADFGNRMFRVSSGNPRKLVAGNRG